MFFLPSIYEQMDILFLIVFSMIHSLNILMFLLHARNISWKYVTH